jgi:hypothetical protein
MSAIDVTERAKLWSPALLMVLTVASAGCEVETQKSAAPQAVYDPRSRQLVRLDWDANGDGRVDQRTYFFGRRAVRTEVDQDSDSRIDRWEYVDPAAAVVRVGSSSANDGVEDTWSWAATASGDVRVDRAQYRDHAIDRREFLRSDQLQRAEEDANRDGLIDKWETWADGALTAASFDTTFAAGRPDRRVVYDGGRVAFLEADLDGNGTFERLASNQPGIRREDP